VGQGAKVYVVDADCAVRESISALLQTAGIASRLFASPQALLDAFDAADAGCVAAEMDGETGSGLHMLGALRGRGHGVPVILFSRLCDAGAKRRAKKAGAAALLAKPTDPVEFIQLVRRLLAV